LEQTCRKPELSRIPPIIGLVTNVCTVGVS
jgi:hypothetical protein